MSSSDNAEPGKSFDSSLIQISKDDGGKVVNMVIKPGALLIEWGADGRYWHQADKPTDPAELLRVCWLEVNGSIELKHLQPGEYKLVFKVSLKPNAFGWSYSPVYLKAKVGSNKPIWKSADLSQETSFETPFEIPRGRQGNSGIKFIVPSELCGDHKLEFSLCEKWKSQWKGGLVIHEVVISSI